MLMVTHFLLKICQKNPLLAYIFFYKYKSFLFILVLTPTLNCCLFHISLFHFLLPIPFFLTLFFIQPKEQKKTKSQLTFLEPSSPNEINSILLVLFSLFPLQFPQKSNRAFFRLKPTNFRRRRKKNRREL